LLKRLGPTPICRWICIKKAWKLPLAVSYDLTICPPLLIAVGHVAKFPGMLI
jgi:hypothetical protein